jgi:hypothetical protein
MMIGLCLAATEMAMRYTAWPPTVVSGWRATEVDGPVNQLGWRGHPWQPHRSADFVVALTGGVQCTQCPADETLDVVLERALRQYNPDARVVTLGSRGYSQDQALLALQEYLSRDRADLIVDWASIADDVPANMFRSVVMAPRETAPRETAPRETAPGGLRLKPTFAWNGNDISGPTEPIGTEIYSLKLVTLLGPMFSDIDRVWTRSLPEADPGAATAPLDVAPHQDADTGLLEQRDHWAVWLTPRPARVSYGIGLTHALFRHMRGLATLHGARFTVLLTPEETEPANRIALQAAGHWYVADPAARDAAIEEVTDGVDTVTLPRDPDLAGSSRSDRNIMARLASVLSQHKLLISAALTGARH